MGTGSERSIDRRSFLKFGTAAALAMMMGGSLTACGGSKSSSSSSSGAADINGVTLGMLNYEDWMGESEIDNFKSKFGCTVKQYATPDGGDSAWVNKISEGNGAYDLTLAGIKVSGTLHDNGLLADFDSSKVPNLSYVPDKYREAYPYGIPVEQGKVGFIYNKEKLPNPPSSWADLFANASQYKQKIVFPSFDTDVIDAGLMSLGLDINTDSTADIDKAKKAVVGIKPYIKAFLDTGGAAAVADGSALICVGYDYDYASVSADSDVVGWQVPSEGMFGYLDGWVPLKASGNLDAVYEFMNFHLDPENYADFINTTGASWLEKDVKDKLDDSIANCIALDPDNGEVTYQKQVSAEISQAVSSAFQEIQNA